MLDSRFRVKGRHALTSLLVVAAGAALGACGGSDEGGGAAADGGAAKTLDGKGKEIVYFGLQPSYAAYLREEADSLKAEAAKLGYKIKFVLNDLNPTQQQQQIQQAIASGEKPAAFMMLPLNPQAAVAQARQLSRLAPVFQISQKVAPGGFKYIKASVGPDEKIIGQTSAQNLTKLRSELRAKGYKFKSPNGGLLYINDLEGPATSADRLAGFQSGSKKEPFSLLQHQFCCADTPGVFSEASKLIPKYKSRLDFMLVMNQGSAIGAAKALRQNGLTPGKDVFIVSGNCGGGPASLLKDGTVAASGQLLANVVGAGMAQVIAQHLATGKIAPGTKTLQYTASIPKPSVTPPAQQNIMPIPEMTGATDPNQKVWGKSLTAGCPLT